MDMVKNDYELKCREVEYWKGKYEELFNGLHELQNKLELEVMTVGKNLKS